MPAAGLGCAIDDDYPLVGVCAVNCNTTCDGSLMEMAWRREDRHSYFPVGSADPSHAAERAGIRAEEIANCIRFIEEQTGETFDWDHYFQCMETFNEETKLFREWLDLPRRTVRRSSATT